MSRAVQRMQLEITRDYRGRALPAPHCATIVLSRDATDWLVELDAPYFADPPPSQAAGSLDGLWNYEVSELFIADDREHYLELELSPHGHHLALELNGVRRVVRSGLPVSYEVAITRSERAPVDGVVGRYHGLARVASALGPAAPTRVNAYLIHGEGAERCYCAHAPTLGETPDFHRLDRFVPLALT
jgi:hypothetical protein